MEKENGKHTNNIIPLWLHFANFKKAIQIELPRGKISVAFDTRI